MYSISRFGFCVSKSSSVSNPSFIFPEVILYVRELKKKLSFFLTMQLLILHVFSLTTIIILSLAGSDGSDPKAGAVAQPLVEPPHADTPDGLENPALG